ncbi:MAG: SurA N-terminal domain-containing protein, partial [Shewanella sp.]|nr:SurA N-terminal domain-containing protein [Shewanella sp.]
MIPINRLIVAFLTLVMSQMAFAAPQPLDSVAVQINSGVILQSEVDNMMADVKRNAAESGQALPSDQALRTQVIERLILTRLQLQMADRMGLHVGDLQLDQTIKNIANDQKMTVEQLRKAVEAS